MTSKLVLYRHAIVHERIDVVVQRLVIEKTFRYQTQVPTPCPLPSSVNLEKGDIVVSVYLVSGGMEQRTLGPMSFELSHSGVIQQTELADVQDGEMGVLGRVWGEIPRFNFVLANLQLVEVFHSRNL